MDNGCQDVKGLCCNQLTANHGWRVECPFSPWDVVDAAGSYAGLVYIALCDLAKGERQVVASLRDVAEMVGVSERTARRARQSLVECAYIHVIRRVGYADVTVLEVSE